MSTIEVSELLRPDLLRGVSIMLAAAPGAGDVDQPLTAAVHAACARIGASVIECRLGPDRSLDRGEPAIERAVAQTLDASGGIEVLVIDGASVFAAARASAGHDDARERLGACLEASWIVTRAVASRAFLAGGDGSGGSGGRIIYLAPPVDAGEHADAARAALENLARTLSIEWARYAISTVAIAPGAGAANGAAAAGEVGALTAYLASAAGAYFSGCLLDLRGQAVR